MGAKGARHSTDTKCAHLEDRPNGPSRTPPPLPAPPPPPPPLGGLRPTVSGGGGGVVGV